MRGAASVLAAALLLAGCATDRVVSQEPPCFRHEPVYFKTPDPLFDPPAAVHYSAECGEGKVAVVRGPRKTTDVFGVQHLKPGSYKCIDVPAGTVPVCLR